MILCLGPTPAFQRVMVFRQLALDAVNRAVITLEGPAGKAVNAAKVLQALGERPVATGFLGGERGAQVCAWLEARGVETDFVSVEAPTRQCVTLIDQATGTVTELVEESQPVAPADYERLLAVVGRRLGACRALVLSGTLPAGGPPDLYARCVRRARAGGVLSLVDARGPALTEALPAGPDVVKPNRAELEATVGRPLRDEAAVLAAARELVARGARHVVVTAGREPTLAVEGPQGWRITPPQVSALNPIGSGDAAAAGLLWRLLRGDDLGEACRWASAAGAANALTALPGEVDLAEVTRLAGAVRVERL